MKKIFDEVAENFGLTESEMDTVFGFCIRKIELCGIHGDDEYMKRFFDDEIRNYVVRKIINLVF